MRRSHSTMPSCTKNGSRPRCSFGAPIGSGHWKPLQADSLDEVRNPLTSISTFIQLVPSRRDDPYFMESFSAQVLDDLARIERSSQEILDYARYMKPKFSAESLNNIVSSCLQFRGQGRQAGDHHRETPRRRSPGHAGRSSTDQAGDHEPCHEPIDAMANTGGRLTVTDSSRGSARQERTVANRSGGYRLWNPQEDLPHIFDPFFTTKHESTDRVGTGLGLSIVHQNIQEMGQGGGSKCSW